MTAYDWPGERAAEVDRAEARARYTAAVEGSNPQLIEEALLDRRTLPAVAPDVGGGGGGGGGAGGGAGGPAANLLPGAVAPRPDHPYLWMPLGPSVVLHGQATNHPRVAGRVRALAVSGDGTRIYAGTGGGGLWYSRDAGASWQSIGGWSDNPDPNQAGAAASVFACASLLVRFGTGPNAEQNDEVFVGTGEHRRLDVSGMPGGDLSGIGLLRAVGPAAWPLYESHWVRHAASFPGATIPSTSIRAIVPFPGGPANRFLLATTEGLYDITVAADPASDTLTKVANFAPNTNAPARHVTDVIATTAPARLWAAVNGSATSGAQLWTVDATNPAAAWQQVALPGTLNRSSVTLTSTGGAEPVYAMSGAGRVWRVTGGAAPAAQRIASVPTTFLNSTSATDDDSQASYDQAITVHPDDNAVVLIGGAASQADNSGEWSAEIFRFRVGGSGTAPAATQWTFAGSGIHADVHALVWSGTDAATRRLWVGCDGGVFRQTVPTTGNVASGEARNTGLATLQTGWVSSHGRSDGLVAAGTQDNGTLVRVGNSVWRRQNQGDGGGLTFHPTVGYPAIGTALPVSPAPPASNDHQVAYQVTDSDWRGFQATVRQPVQRSGSNPLPTHEKTENDAAMFYSGPAVVMSGGTTPRPRLAVGTNRVWLSEDFGGRWRTLPSLVDQRSTLAVAAAQVNTDVPTLAATSDATIVQCRWASPDVLVVLCRAAVLLYRLTTNAAGAVTACAPPVRLDVAGTPAAGTAAFATNSLLPNGGANTDLAIHQMGGAGTPSFYVALSGDFEEPPRAAPPPPVPPPRPAKCSKRNAPPQPLPGPADDPFVPRYETLWWFDGVNTWHGTRLHSSGTGTRAPVQAVVCDEADRNIVYVATGAGVWKGVLTITAGTPSWKWAPFVNGLPEASVHDLSIFHDGQLRLLRAAVASRGIWEVDLGDPVHRPRTYVRVHPHDSRRRARAILTDPSRFNADYRWDASPDVRVRRADQVPKSEPPGEADLLELHTDAGGTRTGSSVFPSAHDVARGNLKIDVLVHHRDPRPLAPADVKVLLLWRAFPAITGKLTGAKRRAQEQAWADLVVDFANPVNALFTAVLGHAATDGAALTAQNALALPAAWATAKPTGTVAGVLVGEPAATLDARTPRSVTFDLTTTGKKSSYLLFVAIAASSLDPPVITTAANTKLRDLVLTNSHVAVTTVRLD